MIEVKGEHFGFELSPQCPGEVYAYLLVENDGKWIRYGEELDAKQLPELSQLALYAARLAECLAHDKGET